VFGRKSTQDSAPTGAIDEAADDAATRDPQAPKGRPTPSRREAEAARRDARKIPADPKAAKRAQKARARKERAEARAGLMAGDERYLPARDRGEVRAFIRDTIDSRWRLSEFFVFIAVGILVAGFIPNPEFQASMSLIWFATTGFVAIEMTWVLVGLNRKLKERWPAKEDRKGGMLYAGMRQLQVRKLRVPPPRVKSSFGPRS
jgi:hypothetical protein